MEKAADMAQAGREPRFSETEVLPPAQSARAITLDTADVVDAVFETLPACLTQTPERGATPRAQEQNAHAGLGLLKQNTGSNAAFDSAHSGITPGFAVFTILSALAVFWLCGGHALLY